MLCHICRLLAQSLTKQDKSLETGERETLREEHS